MIHQRLLRNGFLTVKVMSSFAIVDPERPKHCDKVINRLRVRGIQYLPTSLLHDVVSGCKMSPVRKFLILIIIFSLRFTFAMFINSPTVMQHVVSVESSSLLLHSIKM